MQMSAPWLSIVRQHQAPIHRSPSSYIEGPLLHSPSCLSITSVAPSPSRSSCQSDPQQRHTTPPPIPQSVLPYPLSLPNVRTSSSPAAAQESDLKSQKPRPIRSVKHRPPRPDRRQTPPDKARNRILVQNDKSVHLRRRHHKSHRPGAKPQKPRPETRGETPCPSRQRRFPPLKRDYPRL